jgi:hypothetical protein
MTAALPLGLRNRLAELILDAFDDAEARRCLTALARLCASSDGAVGDEAAGRLTELGWFEAAGPGRLRLRGPHQAHREALCRRAQAAAAVVASAGGEPGPLLAGLLARAGRLADAGLYFEVHELLEPAWLRADGAERVALQGLIQIAVAFQHEANGNHAGAVGLLGDGLRRLEDAAGALPLDAAGFCRELRAVLTAWRAGAAAPAPVRWPRPTAPAHRS